MKKNHKSGLEQLWNEYFSKGDPKSIWEGLKILFLNFFIYIIFLILVLLSLGAIRSFFDRLKGR